MGRARLNGQSGKQIEELQGGMALVKKINIGRFVNSICCDDEFLYVVTNGDYLIRKYRKNDLSLVSTMTGRTDAYPVFITCSDGFLFAAFGSTTTTVWKINTETMTKVAESVSFTASYSRYRMVCNDGYIIIAYDSYIKKISIATMQVVASSNGQYLNFMLIHNAKLYSGAGYYAYIYNLETLVLTNVSVSLDNQKPRGGAIIGGYYYVINSAGRIYKLNLTDLSILSNYKTYGENYGMIAIDNSIFIAHSINQTSSAFGNGIHKTSDLSMYTPDCSILCRDQDGYAAVCEVIYDGEFIFASGREAGAEYYTYNKGVYKIAPKVYKEK